MKRSILMMGLTALILSSTSAFAAGKTVLVKNLAYESPLTIALRQAQQNRHADAFPVLLQYARYGEKVAQNIVGSYYLAGAGTEPDMVQGLVWMAVSLEQREPTWQKNYDGLTAKLTAEQREQLQKIIDQHIAKYGVKAQLMSCNREAKQIGSNQKAEFCKKVRDRDRDVQVVVYEEDAPIPGAEKYRF